METVIRYEALGDRFEDSEAMDLHLDRDRCVVCARRLASPVVKALAVVLRAGQGAVALIRGARAAGEAIGLSALVVKNSATSGEPEWYPLEPVPVLGATDELSHEQTLGLQGGGDRRALFEVNESGELVLYIYGFTRDERPPDCAVDSDGKEAVVVEPAWNEASQCWVAKFSGISGGFMAALIPPTKPEESQ